MRWSWVVTERQRSVIAAIRARIADDGEAPTVREIAAALGLSGPSLVLYQLASPGRGGRPSACWCWLAGIAAQLMSGSADVG
ncbi:hypothetical protein [Streptomyces sp. NPDC058385]|uniref:LexA family protein n=1 Tax=Streptomyces sp. NPDC058385 TaxID=3346473 RepID=UPI00365502CE